MLHTNQAELDQLYSTFCRVWTSRGKATMTASTLYGRLSVKFDFELGTMPAQVLLTILLLSVLVPVTEDMLLKHVAEVGTPSALGPLPPIPLIQKKRKKDVSHFCTQLEKRMYDAANPFLRQKEILHFSPGKIYFARCQHLTN